MSNAVEQARRYFSEIPGAISGSGGHTATYKAVLVLVQDFALDDSDALALLRDWNLTCSPPWGESELIHKLREARKHLDPTKLGCKVRGEARQSPKREPVEAWASLRYWKPAAIEDMGGRNLGGVVGFPTYLDGPEVGVRMRKPDGAPFEFPGGEPHKSHTPRGQKLGLLLSRSMRSGAIPEDADVDIFEGEADCCAAVNAGAKYVIGLPGAKFKPEVMTYLQRLLAGCSWRVTMYPDPGADGVRCGRRVARALRSVGVNLRIAPPPGDDDIDKRLRQEADKAAALRRWRDAAIPASKIYGEEERPAKRQAAGGVEQSKGADLFKLTDLGNAERFKAQHCDRVLYDPSAGWRVWDGQRWALDTSGEVPRLVHATVRSIFAEAAEASNPDEAQRIGQWAVKSQSRDRLAAIPAVAQSLMTVDPRKLDADPWALNFLNGTLDLKTGTLRPHQREDFITRLAPVEYDPAATHPIFEKVIHQSMPDEELRRYAQKIFGITAIGEQVDDLFILVYGPGGTSKTTMVEPFKKALGDYAVTVEPESLMATGRGGCGAARPDIARLCGVRYAISTEVEDGSKLAVGLIKRLSGGDTITARRLYREEFEFIPRFTLWIVSNHRPKADSADDGLWRRVKVIPFDQVIPEDQRDPRIKQAMMAECLPAFLRWAVDGVRLYLEEGLKTPDAVKAATREYQESMDPLTDFIETCCIITSKERIESAELRKAYLQFCEDEGCRYPLSPKQFGERLRSMGFRPFKSHGIRGFEGLGLIGGRKGAEGAGSSVNYPNESYKSSLCNMPPPAAPAAPKEQARAFIDRLARRGVAVRLDDADLVSVLGVLTDEERDELKRIYGAVRAVLAEVACGNPF